MAKRGPKKGTKTGKPCATRVIPQEKETEVLERVGKGETTDAIAAWLSTPEQLNRRVTGRRVRDFIERTRKDRGEITGALIAKEVAKKATADLTAIQDLLDGERAVLARIGKIDDLLALLEAVVQFDPLDCLDANGHVKSLTDMPKLARQAISRFKVKEISGTSERGVIYDIHRWDPTDAAKAIAQIRAEVVRQQAQLVKQRLDMGGANMGRTPEELLAELILGAKNAKPPPIPDEDE